MRFSGEWTRQSGFGRGHHAVRRVTPLRQQLGTVLLAAKHEDAEQAFRQDLVRFPNNGWSLHGLAEALRAQGKTREADEIAAKFKRVSAKADVTLAER